MRLSRSVIAIALIAVVAIMGMAACQASQSGPLHVVLDNAGDIGGGGPAGAAGDTNFTNVVTSGDMTAGGNLDVTGTVNYGTSNVYPIGNVASGKKAAIGITSAKVQSATVVPTAYAITTVTAFGCGPDDAAFSGAWDCRAAMGSTNNITFTLYEVDATPVPTAAYDEIRWHIEGN